MKRIFLLLFLVPVFANGQSDTINRLDSAKKRDGVWIVYLNNRWREVKDSNKATYFKYTYYHHGLNIYPMGARSGKLKLEHTSGNNIMRGKLKLLDGEYTWVDKKGIVSARDRLSNGNYVLMQGFFPTGKIAEVWDYTIKWHNNHYTYTCTLYDKKGGVTQYYFGIVNGKWNVIVMPKQQL